MSEGQYRLDSFRSWNPFKDSDLCHEKPPSPQNMITTCSYPSPVSITAIPTSLSQGAIATVVQESSDNAQRHPLPARPPIEVCLDDESQSVPLQGQIQAEISRQSTFADNFPRTPDFGNPSRTPLVSETTDIDPEILIDSSSSTTQRILEATSSQNVELASDISSIVSPLVVENPVNLDLTVSDQRSTNRSSYRKKNVQHDTRSSAKGKGKIHKQPSFFLVRSQFLASSVEDRLQFLSWLFEGALQNCDPFITVKPTSSTKENCPVHAVSMNGYASRTPNFSPANAQELPSDEIGLSSIEGDETEYEVEKILNHRIGSHGLILYLVKWKGYENSEATWEPRDFVRETAALENYERQLDFTRKQTNSADSVVGCQSSLGRRFTRADSSNLGTRSRTCTTSRKGLSWTFEEERLVVELKVHKKLPWSKLHEQFIKQFPGRSEGSIKIHWSTNIKKKHPIL